MSGPTTEDKGQDGPSVKTDHPDDGDKGFAELTGPERPTGPGEQTPIGPKIDQPGDDNEEKPFEPLTYPDPHPYPHQEPDTQALVEKRPEQSYKDEFFEEHPTEEEQSAEEKEKNEPSVAEPQDRSRDAGEAGGDGSD